MFFFLIHYPIFKTSKKNIMHEQISFSVGKKGGGGKNLLRNHKQNQSSILFLKQNRKAKLENYI